MLYNLYKIAKLLSLFLLMFQIIHVNKMKAK